MTEVGDAALIEAIVVHRSELAARQLVDRHSPRLLAIVSRMLAADRTEAEDVLQQSWIKGIEALPRFRGSSGFFTWMTRIAIRTALDHLRARRPTSEDVGTDDVITHAAAPTEDIEGRIDIERLIARLPTGCRGVFVLHDIEGFTHEEIAATLAIATGTSKAHLFRARQLLRGWLAPHTDQQVQA